MKKINKNAFTLVELIIVITILSILATIWFLSFKTYIIDARDWNRITNIKSIYEWLKITKLKKWNFANPDDYLNINWLWLQWYAWESVKDFAKISWNMKDPLDDKYYIYLLSSNSKKIQLWWFLEKPNEIAYINNVYADTINYNERFFYTIWDNIWISLDKNSKTPINEMLTWSITLSSYTWTLSLYMDNTNNFSWTWWEISTELQIIKYQDSPCKLGSSFVLGACKL